MSSFGDVKKTGVSQSLGHSGANVVWPDSRESDNKVNCRDPHHSATLSPDNVLTAMTPKLSQVVAQDLDWSLVSLQHQSPSCLQLNRVSDMIWEIFLIDEKELEPAKDSIILWSCRAPFGVFIIQVMIEDRRGDLLLVPLGEPSLFPVGGELDFVVFADSTPRDA